MANIELFRERIMESGVMDPEGTHHEFKSGMHGQKLDFDVIDDGSDLYKDWVDINAEYIEEHHPETQVILGVANGTNRLALDVARKFNGSIVGLVTEKVMKRGRQEIKLPTLSRAALLGIKPKKVIVLEDVGTTGSSSVQPALSVVRIFGDRTGRDHVSVLTTWQRRAELEKLDEEGIHHEAIIKEPLTTFTAEDCQSAPDGFCKRGWDFIPRDS